MGVPAGDEINVRVRIDGTVAMKDAEKAAAGVKSTFVKGLAGLASSTLGVFYGGITQQAAGAARGFGDMLGRGTDLGRNASEFWGKLGAKQTAAQQTVEAFGLSGKQANREQILSVYNMFKNIEELRAASKANVEGQIGDKELQNVLKNVASDFKFAVNHFSDVMKELGRQFRLR